MAETMRANPQTAPDGIVERAPTPNGNGWFVPAETDALGQSVAPDTLTQGVVGANSLFMQRTILGERFSLKNNGATLLQWGPIYFPSATDGTAPASTEIDHYLQVYDPNAYQENAAYDNGATPLTPQPPAEYGVNYNSSTITFSTLDPDFNTIRHYILAYRTLVAGSPMDVVDERVDLAAQQVTTSSSQAFVQGQPLQGSVRLYRAFPVGDGTNGTYQLVDQFAGVIAVQPYQVSYTDPNGYTVTGWVIAPGQTLAADYTTRDWQILRIDRDVPSNLTIHLPVNNLDLLDVNYSTTYRVYVVNLNNPGAPAAITNLTFPGGAIVPGSVDVRDSILYLPPSMAPGNPVRIYFASYSTFATQPILSYRTYSLSPGAQPGYCYYTNDGGNGALFTLGFTAADVGKTVSVDYQYTDSTGQVHVVLGRPVRIQGNMQANPTIGFGAVPYPGVAGSVVVLNVQGMSFQAKGLYVIGGDLRRADYQYNVTDPVWNTAQTDRIGQAVEDVYVPR